ncbi:MAG: DUF2935 domain-containing protein [Syntrophomonadaceae bacterium]|nr:DUF2935 domain-containing protein [Syntrophomonadaceae bacterium]
MKEHSIFLEAGFVPKDQALAWSAEMFKNEFNQLLEQAVELANDNVSGEVLGSGEVVTVNTVAAEEKTKELTGIDIDLALSKKELRLRPGRGNPSLEAKIERFNLIAMQQTKSLIDFKTLLLEKILECNLFAFNFPLLIEHLREEAMFYLERLEKLQERRKTAPRQKIIEEKVFWDHIMAEHAMFISHLLDPSEKTLITQADNFARVFTQLEQQVKRLEKTGKANRMLRELFNEELKATRDIRDFKSKGGQLILACQVRSIINPLLADHVLREANHFLNELEHLKV